MNLEIALQGLDEGLRAVGQVFQRPVKPKPRRPIIIVTNEDRERARKTTLSGWVVGWGGLYIDDDGWLNLREDAHVFSNWFFAFLASFLVLIPFAFGFPRRQKGRLTRDKINPFGTFFDRRMDSIFPSQAGPTLPESRYHLVLDFGI